MADIVSRIYSNFRGVDFRGEEINLVRSPDSLNVWKDYKETESIRTRPGMSLCVPSAGIVYGIFFYNDEMIVHSGSVLYKIVDGKPIVLFNGANYAFSSGFVFRQDEDAVACFYFKDGKNYLKYDGEKISNVEGYIPTTSIARKPMGGGTKYEDVNMLSDYRINSFLADGASFEFYLDVTNIDEDFEPVVTIDGKVVNLDDNGDDYYNTDYKNGMIHFLKSAPDAPKTDGQDNITVKFKKKVDGYKENILNSTLLQVFDNRVFFSGNPSYPSTVWHCSLRDPSYCSDTDYYQDGMDTAAIRGMVAGNNALWVFREPSDANTTVFYHTPTIDEEYGKIYPSTHSSVTTGCVGKAINFNDDIVFFSERGMEGISGDVTTEQMVAHRSSMVDRKLTSAGNSVYYKDMVLEEWNGYLLVFLGDKVFLADSRAMFQNENHYEYEWFYWELEKEVLCSRVHDGVLYIGTYDGVYAFNDFDADIESYWVTPKDKFNYPHRQKTTNKRGCVAEATGDITVYAKLEDTDFELVGEYKDITDYFVSRIKRKKFKDIQLKFYSKTRFSLETVTLESFIGGYVKKVGGINGGSRLHNQLR